MDTDWRWRPNRNGDGGIGGDENGNWAEGWDNLFLYPITIVCIFTVCIAEEYFWVSCIGFRHINIFS